MGQDACEHGKSCIILKYCHLILVLHSSKKKKKQQWNLDLSETDFILSNNFIGQSLMLAICKNLRKFWYQYLYPALVHRNTKNRKLWLKFNQLAFLLWSQGRYVLWLSCPAPFLVWLSDLATLSYLWVCVTGKMNQPELCCDEAALQHHVLICLLPTNYPRAHLSLLNESGFPRSLSVRRKK